MSKIAVIGLVGNSVFLPVEKFHEGGETVHALGFHDEWGGKGFNQAIASARYGGEVSYLGAVGKDGSKQKIEEFLAKEKVKGVIVEKENERTPYAVIITDKTGTNHVTVYGGAKLEREDVYLFESEIASSDILLLNNEIPLEVNELATEIAQKNGVKVILNPAPAKELPCEFLSKIWLFTPNEFEHEAIGKRENTIVTLGADGCKDIANDILYAGKKVKAVDTTGAGDTFNGVLAVCLGDGMKICEAIDTAQTASAISVTKSGVMESIPTRDEILNFQKNK